MLKRIASLMLITILASCGGGGGSSGTNPLGGGTGTAPATADLLVTSSSTQLANTASASVTITILAVDANRNTVATAPVSLSADNGAVLTNISGSTTDTTGKVTASLTSPDNRANRLITITAVSGGITKTTTVQVSGTMITSTVSPAIAPPSTAGQVQYLVSDASGGKMIGQSVTIVATGLVPNTVSGVTGANGDFVYAYTTPAATGSYSVTASIAGATDQRTVIVQNASTVPIVSAPITAASVSTNPSVVAVNLVGSSTNRSEIRALFLGANNLPLQNVRARFDLNNDPNSIGGTFTTGNSTLYSDANGVVTTAYVPGTRSSPTNGVNIRVCYGVSDTDINLINCVTSKVATLTVTAEPLGVTIGTNGTVIVNTLTYEKDYVVSVSDSAGVAKADVNIAISIDLPFYRKGRYVVVDGFWVKALNVNCANEDTNRNGVLDAGEDVNGDKQLWPRKPDVIISGDTKTGADGTAKVQIVYAQDHGSWVDALITVTASGVSGSEGRATYLVPPTPVPASVLADTNNDPAFKISPYGTGTSCNNPN